MVKKNNSLSLYSPIDDIFNAVDRFAERHFEKDIIGQYSFTPSIFSNFFDKIVFPDFDCSLSYPVSSCYIEEDGTCVLEVAVTGFKKEEIKIHRENNIIKISGEKGSSKMKKYLFNKIAQRNFDVSFELSNKLDFSKIDTNMENGLLEIRIPLKESEKPIKEEIEIK